MLGYQRTATINDKVTGAKATVQIYKPNAFSKLFFKSKNSIIIQPDTDKKESLELSAKIASSFKAPVKSFNATYDYEKDDLIKAFDKAKQEVKSKSWKIKVKNSAANIDQNLRR